MNRRVIPAAAGAVLAAAAVTAAVVTAGSPAGADPSGSSLAQVRQATAKYHDVNVALADGFVPASGCTSNPALGGMGIHYLHPGRAGDQEIVATEPEILVYEPEADGSLRLVAVEWFAADPDQNLATDAGRPSVLGVDFDGPMPGHEPGMPIHFDLHAWIWKHNPAGTFAPWNPTVHCPA